MNFYINRAEQWIARANGDKKAIKEALDRIASNIASMLLGLYSNETIDQYYVRKPSHKEYMVWWDAVRLKYNY
jgi:hypothetical protein